MKILFFIESLRSGGKERRLIELLTGLKKNKNIQCELVLTRSQIHYKEIYRLEIPIHIIERKSGQKNPRLFFQFFKIAKKINPELIHVWGNLAATYAIPTKVILRIPMINNQIADAPLELPKRILSYKLTFPFSNLLISNSKAGLMSYKPPDRKSLVIYNGFDFGRLNNLNDVSKIREQFNIDAKFVIGMVASFSDKKDYKTYISASLKVLKENPNVLFLSVGAGENSKYKKMIPEKYFNNFKFIESQEDILSLMNICDIGVLATYTEGISNAVMEFMALGKPVVATDGGGTKELISDCETGYLVQRNSEDELAEKISILLDDKSLRNTMGESGKIRIHDKFGIDSMIKKFMDVYNKY